MRPVATISIWWQALQDRTFIQAGGVIARSCRVCCLLRLLAARIGPLCTTLPSGTTWYTCVPSTCSASNSAYDPVGTRQMRNSQHRVQPILVASASQVAFQSSVNSYGGSRPLSLAAATSFDGLVSARPHDAPGAELRGDGGRLEQSRRKMR